MKRFLLSSLILFFVAYYSFSQSVGIGTATPNTSAALDITSPIKGLLIPRMNMPGILAITTPAKGLLVYDSAANQLMVNMGSAAVPNWQSVVFKSGWNIAGNSGTNPANQFIGNTDNQPLRFRVNNIPAGELHPATGNIFWGLRAGEDNTTGFSNIAIGTGALKLNISTSNLVAIGDSALFNNSGPENTAIGSKALFLNTTGGVNTATGFQSLFTNTTGNGNTAAGFQSLFSNTTGNLNTAAGFHSLFSNSTGSNNTATGLQSLFSNSTGSNNTATGFSSLLSNTSGIDNTATGFQSLLSNTTGTENTAFGLNVMRNNTAGSFNVAIGNSALFNTVSAQFNTAVGYNAGRGFNLGFNNTLIGASSNVNQDGLFNCVALGESSRCTGNSQVRFGNTSTTSIGGVVGYSNLSDGRYKKNVQEAVKGIDFIMKLRPVTYQLDVTGINNKLHVNNSKEVNSQTKRSIAEQEQTIFTGFVAQEVEDAAITVGYNFSGVDKPKNENDMYGLRYAEFVVPLVKAMQEQQHQIEILNKQNNTSKQIIDELRKRLDKLEKRFK
jgi:trimeric autotransporter adhesin